MFKIKNRMGYFVQVYKASKGALNLNKHNNNGKSALSYSQKSSFDPH